MRTSIRKKLPFSEDVVLQKQDTQVLSLTVVASPVDWDIKL